MASTRQAQYTHNTNTHKHKTHTSQAQNKHNTSTRQIQPKHETKTAQSQREHNLPHIPTHNPSTIQAHDTQNTKNGTNTKQSHHEPYIKTMQPHSRTIQT